MSLLSTIKVKLGMSSTTANNFVLDASADNGTMKIQRENGEELLVFDTNSVPKFSQVPYLKAGASLSIGTGVSAPVNIVASKNKRFAVAATVITCQVDGIYQINVDADFGGTASGICQLTISKNSGSEIITGSTAQNNTSGARSTASGMLELKVGDTIQLLLLQTSGIALSATYRMTMLYVREVV